MCANERLPSVFLCKFLFFLSSRLVYLHFHPNSLLFFTHSFSTLLAVDKINLFTRLFFVPCALQLKMEFLNVICWENWLCSMRRVDTTRRPQNKNNNQTLRCPWQVNNSVQRVKFPFDTKYIDTDVVALVPIVVTITTNDQHHRDRHVFHHFYAQ